MTATLTLPEESIETASLEELRAAYRALVTENRALRALISERTSAAVSDLRAQGLKFNGNLPYGLECDAHKKLYASPHEELMITTIRQLHSAGLSLRAIARTLAERNFLNRKGRPLDATQVSRILKASKEDFPAPLATPHFTREP